MSRSRRSLLAAALTGLAVPAAAQPALTVYNQDFAVVRERIPLELRAGENQVTFSGVTVHLEPDSVIVIEEGVFLEGHCRMTRPKPVAEPTSLAEMAVSR